MLQISREQVLRAQSESIEYGKRSVSIHGPSCSQNHPCIHKNERCRNAKVSENEGNICNCRNPKPSVALRCMLPAVERTQGTQFCQGEQNVCFGFGLGLGKVRGMFCLVLVSVLVLVLVLPRNGKVLVIVCRRVFLEVNNNQTWCFGLNKLILVSNTELNTFKEPRRRHLQGCC